MFVYLMPPKDHLARHTSHPSRLESQQRRTPTSRQLITFVDSQDPNSRSTIQRHTAHHSNAQRRDARLQSLRSTRPRVLEWQRRPSQEAETLTVTSPQSGTSSASMSPAPGLRAIASAPDDIATDVSTSATPLSRQSQLESSEVIITSFEEAIIEDYLIRFCECAHRDILRETVKYIRTVDTACMCLLIAYILILRSRNADGPQAEIDGNDAQQYYGRGTRLLRDRLTNPDIASSDQNIQAVLLLIAYAADSGAPEEVTIHVSALRRMLRQRGGIESVAPLVDRTLMMQLRTIGRSRRHHITLGCDSSCSEQLRFDTGLDLT